ncbi:MAG: hypothetical protein LBB38_03535 [Puniceicoccales bacterium]|jgi:hypothetical protein|nr:hypothetical protein [Puniceicoccales bacterium]
MDTRRITIPGRVYLGEPPTSVEYKYFTARDGSDVTQLVALARIRVARRPFTHFVLIALFPCACRHAIALANDFILFQTGVAFADDGSTHFVDAIAAAHVDPDEANWLGKFDRSVAATLARGYVRPLSEYGMLNSIFRHPRALLYMNTLAQQNALLHSDNARAVASM